jgi:2-polyprenyl-3-methyl-5-hydroxy-6-metoxy-1,4-benzoquinol methylase
LPAAYADWRASALGQITNALDLALMLQMIRPGSGQRMLDVGCGDGHLSLEMWRRGANVIGIDASPEMIAASPVHPIRPRTGKASSSQ